MGLWNDMNKWVCLHLEKIKVGSIPSTIAYWYLSGKKLRYVKLKLNFITFSNLNYLKKISNPSKKKNEIYIERKAIVALCYLLFFIFVVLYLYM